MYKMSRRFGALTFSLSLVTVLSGCQSGPDKITLVNPPPNQTPPSSVTTSKPSSATGDRKLTVVDGAAQSVTPEAIVDRIHRLEEAHIEKWLSDDEIQVEIVKQIKPATATVEAKYTYTSAVVELAQDQVQNIADSKKGNNQVTLHEQPSPDGKLVFIQKWKDKYSASNFIRDVQSGTLTPVPGDNYMEVGEWLDNKTYVLAAGSTSGRGEIRRISADGSYTMLELNDADTEVLNHIGTSGGRIYYTDNYHQLKAFEPDHSTPILIAKNIGDFQISPDGQWIAVATFMANDKGNTQILIYTPSGQIQGSMIGKGDMMLYLAWSPNSQKLAFALYSEEKSGMNGLYIYDSGTGSVSPLGPTYYPVYPLNWSPSGRRLGVTMQNENSGIVTQILDFK
ncbi:Tol biopolymer transport system component [Paenibacillus shirakamiensis]|uniref:Tol biopolymer transport system component n=1 Tax=Paenibacillus shirakamiensis TaxID=1265935 RepID=A0ABS4JID1_9BACL|nr:WD40 repeat domain-containing protein [Paenibacillus shirakamiensis]MBP2001465.1 Tol biopolymer transport system component [Paenibacillus shirakamiensis]